MCKLWRRLVVLLNSLFCWRHCCWNLAGWITTREDCECVMQRDLKMFQRSRGVKCGEVAQNIGAHVDPCQLHPFQAPKLRKQRVLIRAFEIIDGVVCSLWSKLLSSGNVTSSLTFQDELLRVLRTNVGTSDRFHDVSPCTCECPRSFRTLPLHHCTGLKRTVKLFRSCISGYDITVVSDRLNIVNCLKRTNQIISFERTRHMIDL